MTLVNIQIRCFILRKTDVNLQDGHCFWHLSIIVIFQGCWFSITTKEFQILNMILAPQISILLPIQCLAFSLKGQVRMNELWMYHTNVYERKISLYVFSAVRNLHLQLSLFLGFFFLCIVIKYPLLMLIKLCRYSILMKTYKQRFS